MSGYLIQTAAYWVSRYVFYSHDVESSMLFEVVDG